MQLLQDDGFADGVFGRGIAQQDGTLAHSVLTTGQSTGALHEFVAETLKRDLLEEYLNTLKTQWQKLFEKVETSLTCDISRNFFKDPILVRVKEQGGRHYRVCENLAWKCAGKSENEKKIRVPARAIKSLCHTLEEIQKKVQTWHRDTVEEGEEDFSILEHYERYVRFSETIMDRLVEELTCPISLDLPNDPIVNQYGYIYDSAPYAEWYERSKSDPKDKTFCETKLKTRSVMSLSLESILNVNNSGNDIKT